MTAPFDWDDPGNWPGDMSWPARPGDAVEGRVTRMEVRTGRFGRPSLCVELNSDGRQRWANSRLWRALGELRVQVGDVVKVTRGQDVPPQPGLAHCAERSGCCRNRQTRHPGRCGTRRGAKRCVRA